MGLTCRSLLNLTTTAPRQAAAADPVAAATHGGFLADIFASNDRMRQQISALSSKDYQSDLTCVEVTATAPAAGGDIDLRPDSQAFKDALRDYAIAMSGAKADTDVVFVKWRADRTAPDGVSQATVYSIGFSPVDLHTTFIQRTQVSSETTLGGLALFQSGLTVLNAPSARGFRFYVPIPSGWTDEQLMEAMVMQGGLDPDHILNFGADLAKGLKVAAPSGDNLASSAHHTGVSLRGVTPLRLNPVCKTHLSRDTVDSDSHMTITVCNMKQDCLYTPPIYISCQ